LITVSNTLPASSSHAHRLWDTAINSVMFAVKTSYTVAMSEWYRCHAWQKHADKILLSLWHHEHTAEKSASRCRCCCCRRR